MFRLERSRTKCRFYAAGEICGGWRCASIAMKNYVAASALAVIWTSNHHVAKNWRPVAQCRHLWNMTVAIPTLYSALFDKIDLWNRGWPVITFKNIYIYKQSTRMKLVGRQGYPKICCWWHLTPFRLSFVWLLRVILLSTPRLFILLVWF